MIAQTGQFGKLRIDLRREKAYNTENGGGVMKRITILALLLALVLSLSACGQINLPERAPEVEPERTQATNQTKPTQAPTLPPAEDVKLPTAEPATFPTTYPEDQLERKYSDDYGNSVKLPAGVDVFDYTLSFAELPAVTPQSRYIEAEILRLTNLEREKKGLQPLLWEGDAYYFATVRAKEAQEKWSHTRPNGEPYHQIFAEYKVICTSGENLHAVSGIPNDRYIYTQEGVDKLSAKIVSDWMDSEGHRANILNKDWASMAVAVYYDAKADKLVSVQLFFA